MSASQHRRTCDELGVCQNRQPRCPGCHHFDRQDIPPMVASVVGLAALLVLHFGGWLP